MKKYWIGILVIVVVALATIFFITQTKKGYEEIKIGVITTLTGESAKYGQSALNGIQMAAEEINKKGGIKGKQIKLIIEDDGSVASRAVSALNKLATIDKVPIVIGPISSSAAMATSPKANALKIVLFSPAAATPAFTSPDDYTFRNRVSSEHEISELAIFAYQRLKLRRVAILYVNNEWGLGARKSFKTAFESLSGNIIDMQAFSEGDTDIRTQLTKLKEQNPDGVFLVGQGTEGGYALRQSFELGFKTQFLSVLSIERTDIIQIAGKASNGVIYSAPLYDPSVSQKIDEFNKKYKQRYGPESDLFSGNGYDSVFILAKAIEMGGYSANAIKNTLFTIKDYPGVTGNTTFDQNGDVIKPVSIKIIRDGKFIYFNDKNEK
jgi:branched-chain amino acid transport system substrate-binding protein